MYHRNKKKQKTDNARPNASVTVNASTSTNLHDGDGNGDAEQINVKNDSSVLWKSRKHSKTNYLSNYFKTVATYNNNKMDVICKLCTTDAKPYSITVGNNSNLMNHLKVVSLYIFNFCWCSA